jgi:hypothetical protein
MRVKSSLLTRTNDSLILGKGNAIPAAVKAATDNGTVYDSYGGVGDAMLKSKGNTSYAASKVSNAAAANKVDSLTTNLNRLNRSPAEIEQFVELRKLNY